MKAKIIPIWGKADPTSCSIYKSGNRIIYRQKEDKTRVTLTSCGELYICEAYNPYESLKYTDPAIIEINNKYVLGYSDPRFIHDVTQGERLWAKSYKVIASTDISINVARPSDEFVKEYCKLGGIDEVMVEHIFACEECGKIWIDKPLECKTRIKNPLYTHDRICCSKTFVPRLKVNPDDTINIKIVKDSWSREEVILLCKKAFNAGSDWQYSLRGDTEIVEDNFDDWLKEKL